MKGKDMPGVDDILQSRGSAVADQIRNKYRDRDNYPHITEAEIEALAKEAEDKNVFGHDAKKDSKGNWIPQGVGAPGHESISHFQSIRRHEGEDAYRRAVAEIWKRDPDRAMKLSLPQPAR